MPRPSTPDHLLDVAERLLADHGLDGVSLRRINQEAGLNPAAIHYHFGSKRALIEAVVLRRMQGLMERRAVLLERLSRSGEPPGVRPLVEVMILPLAELWIESPEVGRRYLRFLSRVYAERSGDLVDVARSFFREDWERVVRGLSQALPERASSVLPARLALAAEAIVHGLANAAAAGRWSSGEPGLEPREFVQTLIDFVAGGLSAPAGGDRSPGARA